jgi:hypothetical protein
MSLVGSLLHGGTKMPLWLVVFFLLSVTISVDSVRITTNIQFVVGNGAPFGSLW